MGGIRRNKGNFLIIHFICRRVGIIQSKDPDN